MPDRGARVHQREASGHRRHPRRPPVHGLPRACSEPSEEKARILRQGCPEAGRCPRRISEAVRSEVVLLMRERDWSPQMISERLRKERWVKVSHEWSQLHRVQDEVD